MSEIRLEKVTKCFPGGTAAVKELSLEVNNHELLVLTGPSDCGKSTLLRLIAGLDDVSSGEIYIDNKLANFIDPIERNIAIVYQNLMLYPHLSIWGNLEFGLKFGHHRSKHLKESIRNTADTLEISNILDKFPSQIDMFERQRVAFAKAMVKQPTIFLVDRVGANCDDEQKRQLFDETIKIWTKIKRTMIVAIDSDILSVDSSARFAVMNRGKLEQAGSYDELYSRPGSKFMAGFMGKGRTSFISTQILEENGRPVLKIGHNYLPISDDKVESITQRGFIGKEAILALRPEDIKITQEPQNQSFIKARVDAVEILKGETFINLVTEGIHFFVKSNGGIAFTKGDEITCSVDINKLLLFDRSTEELI